MLPVHGKAIQCYQRRTIQCSKCFILFLSLRVREEEMPRYRCSLCVSSPRQRSRNKVLHVLRFPSPRCYFFSLDMLAILLAVNASSHFWPSNFCILMVLAGVGSRQCGAIPGRGKTGELENRLVCLLFRSFRDVQKENGWMDSRYN